MEWRAARHTDVSPTDNTIPIDTERTVAAPRFDEKSVQRAQPAVPLTLRGKARTWPLAVVLTCILAGLAGGLLGGVALMKYQGSKTSSESASAPTQTAPAQDAPHAADGRQAETGAQSSNNQQASGEGQAAAVQTPDGGQPAASVEGVAESNGEASDAETGTRGELRAALDGWLAATNARDVGGQMKFYAPTVEAFYLSRNATREAVREEKSRLFSQARAVEVRASEPEIRLSSDGRRAIMRFRKRYRIDDRGGEVLQELRWRRTDSGWRIVGERDLRVIQ